MLCKYRIDFGHEMTYAFERKLRLDNPNDDVRASQEKQSERDRNRSKVVKYTHESLWKLKIWFQLRLNCILYVVIQTHTYIYFTAFQIVCVGNLVPYVKQTNRPIINILRFFFRDTNETIRRFTFSHIHTYIYIYNPLKLNNEKSTRG